MCLLFAIVLALLQFRVIRDSHLPFLCYGILFFTAAFCFVSMPTVGNVFPVDTKEVCVYFGWCAHRFLWIAHTHFGGFGYAIGATVSVKNCAQSRALSRAAPTHMHTHTHTLTRSLTPPSRHFKWNFLFGTVPSLTAAASFGRHDSVMNGLNDEHHIYSQRVSECICARSFIIHTRTNTQQHTQTHTLVDLDLHRQTNSNQTSHHQTMCSHLLSPRSWPRASGRSSSSSSWRTP